MVNGRVISFTEKANNPLTSLYIYITALTWTKIAVAGVAGTVAVVAAPAFLTAAGFTSAGVAAGSIAAAAQSTFYGGYVASGSAFAIAQSAGAVGIGAKAAAAIGAAVGGVTLCANKE